MVLLQVTDPPGRDVQLHHPHAGHPGSAQMAVPQHKVKPSDDVATNQRDERTAVGRRGVDVPHERGTVKEELCRIHLNITALESL